MSCRVWYPYQSGSVDDAVLKSVDEVKGEEFIYLTTKGRKTGRSHKVELWFGFSDGRLYLSHEGEHTDWIRNLERRPRVDLEVGGAVFEGEARVASGDAREAGKKALYVKYYGPASKEVIDDWFDLSTVVEITLTP